MAVKKRWLVAAFLAGWLGLFLSGPRILIDTRLNAVNLPANLELYLRQSEARYSDITPGAEKAITWYSPSHHQTALSLIYLPGFSATRQESSPVTEQVATDLEANLFGTRFTGHGRTGPAMAESSVNAWLNDGAEALAIGQRLGKKQVLMAVSTGASTAMWLAAQPQYKDQIAALILISPNFGPADPKAAALSWPWGQQLAELLIGPERSWKPQNAQHARYWTWKYPTRAIMPMMGMVNLARNVDFSQFHTPTLMIYSPRDQVINPQAVEQIYHRLASEHKRLVPFTNTQDPDQHILAGDIITPRSNSAIREIIHDFMKRVRKP